jgi:hypothetical protein
MSSSPLLTARSHAYLFGLVANAALLTLMETDFNLARPMRGLCKLK